MAVAELTESRRQHRSGSKPRDPGKCTSRRPGRFGNSLVDLLTAVRSLPDDARCVLADLIRVIAADPQQSHASVAAMRRSEVAGVHLPDGPPLEPLAARPNSRPLVGAALAAVPNGNCRQLAEYIARRFGATLAPHVVSAEAAVLRRRAWDGRLDLSARRMAELVRLVEVIGGDQLLRVVGLVSR